MAANNFSARASVRIHAAPADVFRTFVDARQMSKFWFTRHDDGLSADETYSWYLGSGDDAISFDVRVKEIDSPRKLVIEWPGYDGERKQVTWLFAETEDGETILSVEEVGFAGDDRQTIEGVLDSNGGFNQVVIAAKALIEHGVEINVVADHA